MTKRSWLAAISTICLIIAAPANLAAHLLLFGFTEPSVKSVAVGAALLPLSIILATISAAIAIASLNSENDRQRDDPCE